MILNGKGHRVGKVNVPLIEINAKVCFFSLHERAAVLSFVAKL